MLVGFLNPQCQCTGRLVNYALNKDLKCVGFVCGSNELYDGSWTKALGCCGHAFSSGCCEREHRVAGAPSSDRLKAAAQPHDYIIVDDIEEGYRQIDAMVLGIGQ